jgi:hypothetical protein
VKICSIETVLRRLYYDKELRRGLGFTIQLEGLATHTLHRREGASPERRASTSFSWGHLQTPCA